MEIIVQKYGGTSVANVTRIEAVADRICSYVSAERQIVVVVSAMNKTTDDLYSMACQIMDNPEGRELDMLLTAGERITMSLLSMALCKRGIKATSFTGSQSGIITDDRHNQARIIEVRADRIIKQLLGGQVVIVAGFQGVSGKREVTTLGRGGSDTTAVVLAHALGAEICEIYTDVDGVLDADPRICENPRQFESLDADELLDMAIFGASVIHPRAIEIARRFGIPIHIKSSLSDKDGTRITPGTKPVIGGYKDMERARVNSVSARDDIAVISGSLTSEEFGAMLELLRKNRISTLHPTFKKTEKGYDVFFWLEDCIKLQSLRDEFSNVLDIRRDCGVIAITGFELFSDLYLMKDLIETVESITDVNHLSSTSTAYYVFIDKEKIEKAMKKVHRTFVAR